MTATTPTKPICLPPAPCNGGKLETAPPKVGHWAWQPKIDDWRGIVHTPTMTVWNQYGALSSVAERGKLGVALALLTRPNSPEWLDIGIMQNRHDMMRGSIVILDAIGPMTFSGRRAELESMFPVMPKAVTLVGHPDLAYNHVYLIPQVIGEEAGRGYYHVLQSENTIIGRKFYEGVVAKKLDSIYPMAQKPKTAFSGWIKHRFDQ